MKRFLIFVILPVLIVSFFLNTNQNAQSAPVASAGYGPSPRSGYSMAYDIARRQTILFGGRWTDAQGYAYDFNDTWAWNGASWTKLSPATSPSPRSYQHMAYDARWQKIIMFGGNCPNHTTCSDTWEWDGANWKKLSPPHSPPTQLTIGMAYNQQVGTIFYGGFGAQFWYWDGTDWTDHTPKDSMGMLNVIASDGWFTTMVHGCTPDNTFTTTWLMTANSTFVNANPATDPRCGKGGLAGQGYGEFVLLREAGTTWVYGKDGLNWVKQNPAKSPSVRYGFEMVYDITRDRVVMFGGFAGSYGGSDLYYGDTWEWDGTNWTLKDPGVPMPTPRVTQRPSSTPLPTLTPTPKPTATPGKVTTAISTGGGSLIHEYPGHKTSLTVPPDTFSVPMNVTMQYVSLPNRQGSLMGMDHFFRLIVANTVFKNPLTLVLQYDPAVLGAVIPGTEGLYWQTNNGSWSSDGFTITERSADGFTVQFTRLNSQYLGILGETNPQFLPFLILQPYLYGQNTGIVGDRH